MSNKNKDSLTEKQLDQIEKEDWIVYLLSCGFSLNKIVTMVGCSKSTVYRLRKENNIQAHPQGRPRNVFKHLLENMDVNPEEEWYDDESPEYKERKRLEFEQRQLEYEARELEQEEREERKQQWEAEYLKQYLALYRRQTKRNETVKRAWNWFNEQMHEGFRQKLAREIEIARLRGYLK